MGLISTLVNGLLGGVRAGGDPNDERYWSPVYQVLSTATGIPVTPELALSVSCIFQGTRLIAETTAGLPLILYRELDGGGKERAKDLPLWRKLRKEPNPWQTAVEWRETMLCRAVLWGVGLSEIIPGADGFVDDLIPIDPNRSRLEQLDNYRLRCIVREKSGLERVIPQEHLFRLPGLSLHPFAGSNVLFLAREAISLWLAMERFGAYYFAQGANGGIWLEHPSTLSDPAYKRLKETTSERMEGLANAHRTQIAEEGMKVKQIDIKAKDAQMVEARDAQVNEIARWLNIPEHMLRAGKQPTFASIQEFNREFVDYTIGPWCRRFESAVERDLVIDEDVYAEHLFEGLLRGNSKERFDAYGVAIQAGFMTRNEVRQRENLNPLPGLDEPLTPLNMERTTGQASSDDEPPSRRRRQPPPPDDDEEEARSPRRLLLIARSAAARVVRKEISRLTSEAVKLAKKPEAWREFVAHFYADHEALVAEALQLEPAIARGYIERHRDELLASGVGVLERWETEAVEELTRLSTEETADVA